MKTFFFNISSIMVLVSCSFLSSCEKSESDIITHPNLKTKEQVIECQLVDLNTMFIVSEKIELLVDSIQRIEMAKGSALLKTNAYVQMSEEQIKQEMRPFVESGKQIQKSLISITSNPEYGFQLTSTELESLKKLDDSQLAYLSMQLSIVYAPENYNQINGLMITTDRVIDCLLKVTGIADIKGILNTIGDIATGGSGSIYTIYQGQKLLMSAKTTFQVFKAIAVKYIGWIGLAYTLYDFADCIKNK